MDLKTVELVLSISTIVAEIELNSQKNCPTYLDSLSRCGREHFLITINAGFDGMSFHLSLGQ